MRYDVQIYIDDAQLPSYGRENLTANKMVEYLSVVLRRHAHLNKKLFRISVSESDGFSSVLREAMINFPPFKDLEFKFKNKK